MLLPLYPGCSIKDKWKINNTGQARITKNTKVFPYLYNLVEVLELKEREGPLWIIGTNLRSVLTLDNLSLGGVN